MLPEEASVPQYCFSTHVYSVVTDFLYHYISTHFLTPGCRVCGLWATTILLKCRIWLITESEEKKEKKEQVSVIPLEDEMRQ